MNIRTWLGKHIEEDQALHSEPVVVKPRHNADHLSTLTKKEVIQYAQQNGIAINSRKKKEELIEIIMRS